MPARILRLSPDGTINMVQEPDGSLSLALQDDLDQLAVGPDLTSEEIDNLES